MYYLKGRSSRKLLAKFASLRKTLLGPASVGTGLLGCKQWQREDEVWMEYIKSQTQPEPDDDFRVT